MSQELIHRRRWVILAVLVMSLLVVVLDSTILNVALKRLSEPAPRGLGASQTELEWGLNSYTLAFAGLLFTFGVLGDRWGRKRLVMGGMVAFGLSSLCCAYASSPDELIAFRALMGVSGAAVLPVSLSIVMNVFEPAERPKAIGFWAGTVGLAIAIGPITGGILLAHFWWGSVFLINVPICAIAVVLMWLLVPESRDPNPGRLDPVGVVLSIAGVTALVYGIVRSGDHGWIRPDVLITIFAGIALLFTFVRWEQRFPSPILDVQLFRNKSFSSAVGIITLVFLAYLGLVFLLSFYFQAARGYSPLHTGVLLLPLAVAQLITSSRSPLLVRRYGPRAVGATGMVLMSLVFLYYTQAGAHSPVLPLLVVLALQGAAIGGVATPATTAVMSVVPRHKAGSGSAITNTARQVGGCLGIAVLGAITTSIYRSGIDPHLHAIPALAHQPGAIENAGASITATLNAAARLGPAGHALAGPAVSSFMSGMHAAALGSLILGLVGVAVALKWLPRGVDPHSPAAPAPAGAAPGAPAAPETTAAPGTPSAPGTTVAPAPATDREPALRKA